MEYKFRLGLWEHYVANLRITLRKGPLLLLHALYPVLGIYLGYWQWQDGVRSPWMYLLLLAIFGGFTPLITLLSVVIRRAQSRGAFEELTVRVDDDGLTQETAVGDTHVVWTKLLAAQETNRFFLFFITNRMAIPLPKRVVKSDAELATLRSLLLEHLGARVRLPR